MEGGVCARRGPPRRGTSRTRCGRTRGRRVGRAALLDSALEDQHHPSLVVALAALERDPSTAQDPVVRDARSLPSPARLKDPGEAEAILDELVGVATPRARVWAAAARVAALTSWIPANGSPGNWTAILTRLDRHARALHALECTAKVAELAVERSRPVRLAIVGEFNAGKSTFINAMMGADVAPTGVLPTTATLHHLRYAPDPFARIQYFDGDVRERIVPSSELRAALKAGDTANVKRVEILMPIASLTRVEVLDTPGFNAPDPRHTDAARSAFEEADAALWLLDATQALKQSERRILDEAKAATVPVQILVNKADRLKPEEIDHVMRTMAESLEEAGLSSWSPPIAFSARLALQGKLGDAGAFGASGWANVQRLLDEEIIGRSAELKERGLRRRASRVVGELLDRARVHAQDEQRQIESARARAQDWALRAAKLERETEESAQIVAGALGTSAEEWRRDLDVVVTGRDAAQAEADPVLLRYRTDRAIARLAPPLARARHPRGRKRRRRRGCKRSRSRAALPRRRANVRGHRRARRSAAPAHAERRFVARRALARTRPSCPGAAERRGTSRGDGGDRRRARARRVASDVAANR